MYFIYCIFYYCIIIIINHLNLLISLPSGLVIIHNISSVVMSFHSLHDNQCSYQYEATIVCYSNYQCEATIVCYRIQNATLHYNGYKCIYCGLPKPGLFTVLPLFLFDNEVALNASIYSLLENAA